MNISFQSFDARSIPLTRSNLVEASAGTGKTYSIAILLIRLILEKQIPIREVLMVTFTNAAVAELEERIRSFLRACWKVSKGEAIPEKELSALVHAAIERFGQVEVQNRLKDAILFLDETSVMTIHGFCQKVLKEHAFEAGQIFGAEIRPDFSSVQEEEFNRFWRKHMTSLPLDFLRSLVIHPTMRETMLEVVREHLNGKKYFPFNKHKTYDFHAADYTDLGEKIGQLNRQIKAISEKLRTEIEHNRHAIVSACEEIGYARTSFLPFEDAEKFIKDLNKKKGTKYVRKMFPQYLIPLENCHDLETERDHLASAVMADLICFAIQEVLQGIKRYKAHHNLMGYDDMIQYVHDALVKDENTPLQKAIRKKYRAVFIDEFQDTDRLQYEIFEELFLKDSETISFLIGDPKQSIYAWRKADIFTYFSARGRVGTCYEMNVNYRSTPPMIAALNHFFSASDPFCFNGEPDRIHYIPVLPPQIQAGEQPAMTPLIISIQRNKTEITKAVVSHTAQLLWGGQQIQTRSGTFRAVRPADIGILVRTRKEGNKIARELSMAGISCVHVEDQKVLQTSQATDILYLLEAMNDPCRGQIHRALLSPFTGMHRDDLVKLNEEEAALRFKTYQELWKNQGIYAAMMRFATDFNLRRHLTERETEGDRALTNFYQIAELIHRQEVRQECSNPELISWLRFHIEGIETIGDEYLQRIESDDEAVKIVTIHKSKGLEYPVVLAPYLDLTSNHQTQKSISFRDPETREYVVQEKVMITADQEKWAEQQREQENRRLIYVALTRAVSLCIVFKSERSSKTALSPFVRHCLSTPSDFISITTEIPHAALPPKNTIPEKPVPIREPRQFCLIETHWRRISYSYLKPPSEWQSYKTSNRLLKDYDHFIFHVLPRGKRTGNLLHAIFEHISFQSEEWDQILEQAVDQFAPLEKQTFLLGLNELIHQVLHINLGSDDMPLRLSEVSTNRRIHEFEFNFPVSTFYPEQLNNLSSSNFPFQVRPGEALEGIMNGKIDMFFQHKDKFYILDWKSDFLGDDLDAYTPEKINEKMAESNYHLQYLIYTLAAKKYLKSRLGDRFRYERDFGGVYYLFLRGLRKDHSSGIFFRNPSPELIGQLETLGISKRTRKIAIRS